MVVPVLIGVGRSTQQPVKKLAEAWNPIQLAESASRIALKDAEIGLEDVDAVVFIDMLGEFRLPRKQIPSYDNPALTLARSMGMSDKVKCLKSTIGGNSPQFCVNEAAERICKGEFKTCLITGTEAIDTLMKALKRKYKLTTGQSSDEEKLINWGDKTGIKPELIGSRETISTVHDLLHNLTDMPTAYAVMEEATRISDGVSLEERSRGNAKLFSGLSKISVAKENQELSWFPRERSEEEIYTVDPKSNRMVSFPYNKLSCSIMDVNQGASVIITSDVHARELGIPEKKWVYLHGSADCSDIGVALLEKPVFNRSYGMEIVGNEIVKDSNVKMSDISFFDVYSCFPIAVRMACREMHIPLNPDTQSAQLTVTGGLPFYGGPGNAYVLHSIAAMVEKLRENPGKFGLVTANGGILSKHSAGIYSTTPYSTTHPDHPTTWTRPDCKPILAEMEKQFPRRKVATNPGSCEGIVTNYTITYGKGSVPVSVIAIGDLTSGHFKGQRFVAKSQDKDIIERFCMNPEGQYNLKVALETSDLSGSGKAFLTTFSFQSPSSILTSSL